MTKRIVGSLILALAVSVGAPAFAQETGEKETAPKPVAKKAKKKIDKMSKKITVLDAKAAADVIDREPTGVASTFKTGEQVKIWMAIKNVEEPADVQVVFFRDDVETGKIDVNVGKSFRWRTWVHRTVQSPGSWRAEIRDPEGEILETVEFTVAD